MKDLFRVATHIKEYDATVFEDLKEIDEIHKSLTSPRRASSYVDVLQGLKEVEAILAKDNYRILKTIHVWLIESGFDTVEMYNLIKDDKNPWLLHILTGWDKNLIRFMNNVYNALMDNSYYLNPGDVDIEALGVSDAYHGMLIVPFLRDLYVVLGDMVEELARKSRPNRDMSDITLLDVFKGASLFSYARLIMLGFKYNIMVLYD